MKAICDSRLGVNYTAQFVGRNSPKGVKWVRDKAENENYCNSAFETLNQIFSEGTRWDSDLAFRAEESSKVQWNLASASLRIKHHWRQQRFTQLFSCAMLRCYVAHCVHFRVASLFFLWLAMRELIVRGCSHENSPNISNSFNRDLIDLNNFLIY